MPLRVLLDVNVWVANLIATANGRQGTAMQRIVAEVASGKWGADGPDVQLIVSHEMLETLEIVLLRKKVTPEAAKAYADAIAGLMRYGPEQLDPYILLGGREQFAMTDDEDAGVLATAFASQTTLLATDNLADFQTNDSVRLNTRIVGTSSRERQLYAIRHLPADVDMIVAHPLDIVDWLKRGAELAPEALWKSIEDEAGSACFG